ncbi:hypothetical protein AB0C90_34410 [Streptomyces sp. NPDC048550]
MVDVDAGGVEQPGAALQDFVMAGAAGQNHRPGSAAVLVGVQGAQNGKGT